ncbi:hypothetical protein Sjap_008818 [Stephania japonica]|uniref:Uncharacterized protein n=1 Tax=Stephania japonica TaxID=461633 RepID=A0AAP0JQT1_9MAGN
MQFSDGCCWPHLEDLNIWESRIRVGQFLFTHLAMKWKKNDDDSENNDYVEAAGALEGPPNLQDLSFLNLFQNLWLL